MKSKIGWIIICFGILCVLSVGLFLQYLPIFQNAAGEIKAVDLYTWKENFIIGIPILLGFVSIVSGIIVTVAYWE